MRLRKQVFNHFNRDYASTAELNSLPEGQTPSPALPDFRALPHYEEFATFAPLQVIHLGAVAEPSRTMQWLRNSEQSNVTALAGRNVTLRCPLSKFGEHRVSEAFAR